MNTIKNFNPSIPLESFLDPAQDPWKGIWILWNLWDLRGRWPIVLSVRETPQDYIQKRIIIDSNGCWIWQLYIRPNGYAKSNYGGRKTSKPYIHRFSYEVYIGPIPEGLEIDHKCRVRHCCNPMHLEPVSHYENLKRAILPQWQKKEFCKRGHNLDENGYTAKGLTARNCKICRRILYNAWYAKNKKKKK